MCFSYSINPRFQVESIKRGVIVAVLQGYRVPCASILLTEKVLARTRGVGAIVNGEFLNKFGQRQTGAAEWAYQHVRPYADIFNK